MCRLQKAAGLGKIWSFGKFIFNAVLKRQALMDFAIAALCTSIHALCLNIYLFSFRFTETIYEILEIFKLIFK